MHTAFLSVYNNIKNKSLKRKKKMKKFLAVLILILSLSVLGGCHQHKFSSEWSSDVNTHFHASTCHSGERNDVANHTFVDSGELDEHGRTKYKCIVCGYTHQHIYDASKWEYNGREHWHPATCGHTDAYLFGEEHNFDESGVCTVCGLDEENAVGYEVAFSYYVVDENGNPVLDDSGYYQQVGVVYTSLEQNGSTLVDTQKSSTLYAGDKISFTVSKSVFCYYTDAGSEPLVEVISGTGEGNNTVDTVYPDENGVYTVEIKNDTIISVANVATKESTMTGSGTQADPFTINSEVDWLYFAMFINDKSYYSIDYNLAYWQLNADLDFEGETIYIIGDGYSSSNSVFCGNFNGNGHKISNFVLENSISAEIGQGYSNYVGLFGVMTGYVGVDSVIANLTVENVVVNATASNDDIVAAGCILGYGVGANVRNCVVKNSQINVIADDTYMSFAGGVVGFLQSGMTEEGILFYSSIAYTVSDNVVIKGSGMLYSVGGICGRVVSYNEQATAFVINSYSNATITDAVRAGGIVGELQRYSVVQNCYSTSSVSAHSSFKSAVDDNFIGSVYDDRYSYAGGIVAFAENDTVVDGCFFDGNTYATALLGKNFAKSGHIVAGTSKAGFVDYFASAPYLNNASAEQQITNDYIKNQLKWSEEDWTFGDGYPTINQEDLSRTFTLTVDAQSQIIRAFNIGGQYLPLSYWYILDGYYADGGQTIAKQYSQGALRTHGYYFDSELTIPVPAGYVVMKDITLYTSFVDTTAIAGAYYVSNGGKSVQLTIFTDGTYNYEEGAILLKGQYNFDGQIITFANSFFSRIAETATDTQKANYYTFWAKVLDNGNLGVFDCEELYVVPAENEEQNPTFTTMARFYKESNPLTVVLEDNLGFTGGYYYNDLENKHVFEFNKDFTGSYKKYSGEEVVSDTFTFEVQNDSSIVITLNNNGTEFVVSNLNTTLSIQDNRGDDYTLNKIDAFAGVWEKKATSHKIYTFDGIDTWTYEHFVYLTSDDVVNATKYVVNKDSGTYVVVGDKLTLIRKENGANILVEATIENGTIYITENGESVQVEFNNENSFKGVWYTANNKIIRYTLTLNGLDANGVGQATLDGFNAEPLKLRYTAVSSDTLYLYIDDVVYATLQYSTKTGLFNGMFYDNATGTTSTPQTLYLYDDFAGSWVSNIEGLESIKFNGFGAYDTKDESGNSLAVKGTATIGSSTVKYEIIRQTGKAEFTFGGVKYVLTYNEYTDTILVEYDSKTGVIAKADQYVNMILANENGAYSFDGRGNFNQGGVVKFNDKTGLYFVDATNGNITLKFDGEADKVIVVARQNGKISGYSVDGNALYVDNAFSGKWSVSGKNYSIEIGNIYYLPEIQETIEISGKFNGVEVVMYYNGTDTISFTYGEKTFTLKNTLGGKVPALLFSEKVVINEEVITESIAVRQDNMFGEWKKLGNENVVLTFDGCGDSGYVLSGNVKDKVNQLITYNRKYKIENGVVVIYTDKGEKYATFTECASDTEGDVYYQGDRYFVLEIVG